MSTTSTTAQTKTRGTKAPAPKTRIVFYTGINGDPESHHPEIKVTLAFAKKAAASIVTDKEYFSFFGIEMRSEKPKLFFQTSKETDKYYYVEIGEHGPAHIGYTSARCEKGVMLKLVELAWKCTDKETFLAKAPKLRWRTKYAVVYQQPEPEEWLGDDFFEGGEPESKTLGHGDHWRALDNNTDDTAYEKEWAKEASSFIENLIKKGKDTHTRKSPWKKTLKNDLTQHFYKTGKTIDFTTILTKGEEDSFVFLSAFPSFAHTCTWILDVQSVSNAYGDCEGLISGRTANDHCLEWFAPDFLRYANDWSQLGLTKVSVSGLALQLEFNEAKPWVFKSGHCLEEERQRLRNEGKIEEAQKLKSVSIPTDEIRTFFTDFHDHAFLAGRILELRKITTKTWKNLSGYLLEIEVLANELPTGYILPVYAFPAALGDYVPKKGDLVTGTIWLQGKFMGKASPEGRATFWLNDTARAKGDETLQEHIANLLAIAAEDDGSDYDEAEATAAYCDEGIVLVPDSVELYMAKGKVLEPFAHYSWECFEKVIELDPTNTEAYIRLGRAISCLNYSEKAIALLKKAIELDPNYYEAYFVMARQLEDIKRYEEALSFFNKAIELYPQNALKEPRDQLRQIVEEKGKTLALLGRHEEAIACFDEAISSFGDSPTFDKDDDEDSWLESDFSFLFYEKGKSLAALGRKEECIALYDKLIAQEEAGERGWSYCKKAETLEILNDKEGAIAAYKLAIADNADSDTYWAKYASEAIAKLGRVRRHRSTAQ
jgi:tetratricopeptide (TPR) repeat protein